MKKNKKIKDWCPSSYYGYYIYSTVEELETIFGSPDLIGGKDDKVQFEWLLDLEISNSLGASTKITLYDWKEYRKYDKDEVIRFNIGGSSEEITKLAKKEILKLIKIFNNE